MTFVDGSLEKPLITDDSYRAWSRCNSMQEISDSSQDNLPIAEYYTQLKKTWDEIDNLSPLPVCECANCTCTLSAKFLKMQQDQRLMFFLMKLNNNYSNVRSNILMMDTLPSLPQAYRMLLQEQRHREISRIVPNIVESTAFAAEKRTYNNRFGGFNSNNKTGYVLPQKVDGSQFVGNRKGPSSKYFCDHCKMGGHTIDRCYKIHGYPPNFRGGQLKRFVNCATIEDGNLEVSNQVGSGESGNLVSSGSGNASYISMEQYNHLLSLINTKTKDHEVGSSFSGNDYSNYSNGNALLAGTLFTGIHCLLSATTQNEWILDSGASDHMCYEISSFDSYTQIADTFITIPDGSRVVVTHVGTVRLTDSIIWTWV
ncbi:uncharacterized protein LOC141715196 [Apium graveolens]|uniref:uncharacterized protein LOC141715196 n=1 Tax=Apium graveolens TaxID=4045 RepID=UPI003D7B4B08